MPSTHEFCCSLSRLQPWKEIDKFEIKVQNPGQHLWKSHEVHQVQPYTLIIEAETHILSKNMQLFGYIVSYLSEDITNTSNDKDDTKCFCFLNQIIGLKRL